MSGLADETLDGCRSGGPTAGTCYSRRRWPSRRCQLTEFENKPRAPDGTDAPGRAVRRVYPGVQHERATGDQPAPASQHRRPPHRHPTSLAAYGREDILVRVAAQLESAHPWSFDHPAIPDGRSFGPVVAGVCG